MEKSVFDVIMVRRNKKKTADSQNAKDIMKSQRRKRDHVVNKDGMSFSAFFADHTSDSQFDFLTENDDISFIVGMNIPRGMMTVGAVDLLKVDRRKAISIKLIDKMLKMMIIVLEGIEIIK